VNTLVKGPNCELRSLASLGQAEPVAPLAEVGFTMTRGTVISVSLILSNQCFGGVLDLCSQVRPDFIEESSQRVPYLEKRSELIRSQKNFFRYRQGPHTC